MGSSAYTQTTRPIQITTPLGDGKLLVKSFQGEERISGLFHYTVELVSEETSLDFTQIVGKAVTLNIGLAGGASQYVNAICGRFVQAGKTERLTTYLADLYPWLWLLTMNSDNHIYQNKSAPDIIKQVFGDLGFTDYTDSLTGTYSARDYCVQYNESTYNFVSRLMEEEGIFYFFKHDSSSHKLVLADDASAYQTLTGLTTVNMRLSDADWAAEDAILECQLEQQVTAGQFKADDYNFTTPSTDLLATASGADTSRSVYEYPGVYLTSSDGETVTNKRLLALEAPGKLIRGASSARAFQTGGKFTLAKHYRDDANAEYVLQWVSHNGNQLEYSNSFEAFPSSITFRPARVTPKPRIPGTQTALVVGKSGEEIWTDQYGRVVVQFYWDQLGKKDETSSCWIRVAQGWAGKQWGSIFIPRIGQEVIVSFLEGDPDRPIITGCVYNAEQTVPYALPGEQTKSTVKSNSSKGGNGFNEIRFEDKAGSEEVFVQAQKDMNVTVLNDQTYTITNNRTATIKEKDETLTVSKGNRTINVDTGNETHSVKGKRDLTVTGNETHTNKADYTGTVSGNFTLKVSGNISIEASGSISIKAGTSFANQAGTSFSNQAGTSLENKAGTSLENKAGTTMNNEAGISLTNKGGASQTVDGGGMLTCKAGLVKIN